MGGAERMLQRLVSQMSPDRFHCIVISMTDIGPIGKALKGSGIEVFHLGMEPAKPTFGGFIKLLRILKQESVDILQTWLYHADLLGLFAGRISGTKKIEWNIRCSNMDLNNYRSLTKITLRLNSLLSPFVSAIVANSSQGINFHNKMGYNTSRMFLIPNGFNINVFCPDNSARVWLLNQLNLAENSIVIGLIARYDPMKDHDNFIKAASMVSSTYNNSHFVMAGKGIDINNKKLVSLIASNRLNKRVHLLGLRDDIHKVIAAFDIATSSSSYGEGFSNTIGEAMACGVPCVVTDVGDSASIVADTGIVVKPNSPVKFAKAIIEMIAMPEFKRKDLGLKGRARIKNFFSIDKIINQYENLYFKLAEGNVTTKNWN